MSYQMIHENSELAAFCAKASQMPAIAVDTEFVRVSSLLPKLGLIQLYDGQQVVLVDPLMITDWQPLQSLFANPKIIKLIHSCTEDLEALAAVGLTDINPLVDTQLAAELIGWGASVGYAKLVEQMTGQQLDKSESRTDWLARPLATAQLAYAANDVLYLLPLWPQLQQHLINKGCLDILYAEGQQLIARRHKALPLQFRYLELKNSWQFQGRELAILRDLMAWRQRFAQEKDLALSMVLKEALIYEMARRKPASLEALSQIEGLHHRDIRRHGQFWLGLIKACRELPALACPQTFYHLDKFAGYKQVQQQLTDAVNQAAQASGIPASILSVKRQLNEYLNWCWRVSDEERSLLPLPEFLQGWRREILLPYLPIPEHVRTLV